MKKSEENNREKADKLQAEEVIAFKKELCRVFVARWNGYLSESLGERRFKSSQQANEPGKHA